MLWPLRAHHSIIVLIMGRWPPDTDFVMFVLVTRKSFLMTTRGVGVSLVLRPASNEAGFRDPTWMEFRVFSHLVGIGCRGHCYKQIDVERKRRHLEAMGPVNIKLISAQSRKPEDTYCPRKRRVASR